MEKKSAEDNKSIEIVP
jgi:cell division cycle 14